MLVSIVNYKVSGFKPYLASNPNLVLVGGCVRGRGWERDPQVIARAQSCSNFPLASPPFDLYQANSIILSPQDNTRFIIAVENLSQRHKKVWLLHLYFFCWEKGEELKSSTRIWIVGCFSLYLPPFWFIKNKQSLLNWVGDSMDQVN